MKAYEGELSKVGVMSGKSTANLDVVTALVARLAPFALGDAVLVDLAIDRVARVSVAVRAFGIGLLLDHQLARVPARLGRRLAGRAVLLHEGDLALALVVQGVGRTDVLLASRSREPGARAPVALHEGDLLLLLGLGRNDHRLGLILLALVLVRHALVLAIRTLGIGTL